MDERRFTLLPGEKAIEASWYCSTDMSGHEMEHLCVQRKYHLVAHFDGPPEDQGVSLEYRGRGACDGWCQPEGRRLDLRAHLLEIVTRPFINPTAESTIRKTVDLDAGARELFSGSEPVVGIWHRHTWEKYTGSMYEVCLGHCHVRVNEESPLNTYGWSESVTHTVSVEPCDGSCRPIALHIPERMMQEIPSIRSMLDDVCRKTAQELGFPVQDKRN